MIIRKILFASAVAVALVFAANTAHAGTMRVNQTGHNQGGGGEFRITEYDTYYIPPAAAVMVMQAPGADFLSFCIEWQEHIAPFGTEYLYGTASEAIGGSYNAGAAGPNGGDPISVATAKLFYAYWTGQLASFDVAATTYNFRYGTAAATATELANRSDDGEQLQFALWSLEDESVDTIGVTPSSTAGAGNLLAEKFVAYANTVTWAALGVGWDDSTIGGVRALNPFSLDGTNNQSMLVVVPLPSGALMGLALLAGMAIVVLRRRRRLSAS